MDKNYITIDEVARAFKVTASTIYRWSNNTTLPEPIRLGGIKWNRTDFTDWVNEHHKGVILPTTERENPGVV